MALAAAIVLVVIYVAMFRSTNRRVGEFGGIIRRIAFSYMQMLGVLGIFKARGTKLFNEAIGQTSQVAGGAITSMLAIKCLLGTQIYGPFLVNMMLPIATALLVALIMIPSTAMRRLQEKFLRKKDATLQRKRAAAAHDEQLVTTSFTPPKHEPIVNLGNSCLTIPTKIARNCSCLRKAATEEYIANAKRKHEGQRPNAPRMRTKIQLDARLAGGVPYALMMAVPCCRVATTAEDRRVWRAEHAVRKQRTPFKPNRRFVAVMVLVMYSLYPTLVSSTASMFNCTDPINNVRYLVHDLTVTCYVGWHIVYLFGASASIVVYCFGALFISFVLDILVAHLFFCCSLLLVV